jgi:hypothetical protein
MRSPARATAADASLATRPAKSAKRRASAPGTQAPAVRAKAKTSASEQVLTDGSRESIPRNTSRGCLQTSPASAVHESSPRTEIPQAPDRQRNAVPLSISRRLWYTIVKKR